MTTQEATAEVFFTAFKALPREGAAVRSYSGNSR